MARRAAAASVAVLMVSIGSLCGASEPWAEFSWRAPPPCPDRAQVLEQLESVLQRNSTGLESADVRADVEHVGASWVLSLDVQVGPERRMRQLTADHCEDLADAAAVALVLLLEPFRPADPGPSGAPAANAPAPRGTLDPASITSTVEDGTPPLAPTPAETPAGPAFSWTLGASAVIDALTLGQVTPGGSVQSELRLGDGSVGAYGLVLPARRLAVAPGGWVEFSQWAAGVRFAYTLWAAADWRLGAAANLELGRFAANGGGLNETRNSISDGWFSAGGGAQLSWHGLPHAAFVGRAEALAPLLRHDYVVNQGLSVHHTPALVPRVSIGLEFDLL